MPSLAKMATEAKSKKKTAAPKKPEKKAAPPVSAFKSTEYIEGSDESSAEEDSEDDEEEALKRVAVTTEVNGKTPTGKEDSASESSSEESESDSSSSEEEEDASGSEMSIDKPVEAAKSILKSVNWCLVNHLGRNTNEDIENHNQVLKLPRQRKHNLRLSSMLYIHPTNPPKSHPPHPPRLFSKNQIWKGSRYGTLQHPPQCPYPQFRSSHCKM